jgi:predicted metalloprotease with PDZ domain
MIAAVAILLALSGAPSPDTLRYQVQFSPSPSPAVQVELTFRGTATGETMLVLPSAWGGQADLHRGVRGLRASGGARLEPTGRADRIRLIHPPGETVTVAWSVADDRVGSISQENRYRPIVEARGAHLIGHTWLVLPVREPDEPVFVEMRWTAPAGADAVLTGPGGRASRFSARTTARSLLEAPYLVGRFESRTAEASRRAVHVGALGLDPGMADSLAVVAARLLDAAEARLGALEPGDYVVTAVPVPGGIGGTRLDGAIALFLEPGTASGRELHRLILHELIHEWIGGRLRAAGELEALGYWFSEGFTEFLTDRILLEIGTYSRAAYADRIGVVIEEHARSSAATLADAVLAERFWSDREAHRLPYLRGHLLALHLDRAIGRASDGRAGLVDVLAALLRRAGERSLEVDAATLADAAAPWLDRAATLATVRRARAGEPFDYPEDLLGACYLRSLRRVAVFDLGLDFDRSTEERSVRGIREGGPAHAAGLRDGMPLRGWSVRFGDAEEPVVFVVPDGGSARRVEFLPSAGEYLQIPTYQARAGCAER